jgi:hypothetical protein
MAELAIEIRRVVTQELLLMIYRDLQQPPSLGAENPTPPHPSWLVVSQVCHHWRRVAFICSKLWTETPLRRPVLVALALELSKKRLVCRGDSDKLLPMDPTYGPLLSLRATLSKQSEDHRSICPGHTLRRHHLPLRRRPFFSCRISNPSITIYIHPP